MTTPSNVIESIPKYHENWALKNNPKKVVWVIEVYNEKYVYVHMPWAKHTFQGKSMDVFLKQYQRVISNGEQ